MAERGKQSERITRMSDVNDVPLTKDEVEEVKRAIVREVLKRPPTIGVVGVSGTGKSSTINSMFQTNLAVSHVVACTKEFRDTNLRVAVADGEAAGEEALLRVIDAPGLGEHVARDPAYLEMYRANLSRCDIILWVLTARNRAVALDQTYLSELEEYQPKIVFGINQVDLVEPCNWNEKINLPSRRQEENIRIIVQDRKEKIESVLEREISIVAYSAKQRYNLPEIFTAMIDSCPLERTWIFSAIKGFRPEDFIPEGVRTTVMAIVDAEESVKKPSRGTVKSHPTPEPAATRTDGALVKRLVDFLSDLFRTGGSRE